MKEKIKEVLGKQESMKLDEIYKSLDSCNKDSVRGTINLMVKKNEIERVGRGSYSLKK